MSDLIKLVFALAVIVLVIAFGPLAFMWSLTHVRDVLMDQKDWLSFESWLAAFFVIGAFKTKVSLKKD